MDDLDCHGTPLAEGLAHLQRHELSAAESTLLRVLNSQSDTSTQVTCLCGLAELYLRRSRTALDVSQWQWRCLQTCGALRRVIKLCSDDDNWLQRRRNVASGKLNSVETELARTLLLTSGGNELKYLQELGSGALIEKLLEEQQNEDIKQEERLQNECRRTSEKRKAAEEQRSQYSLKRLDSELSVEESPVTRKYSHRGFVDLVRDIAADVRGRHRRRRLSEQRLRDCVTSQLMQLENIDILGMLCDRKKPDDSSHEMEGIKEEQPPTTCFVAEEPPSNEISVEDETAQHNISKIVVHYEQKSYTKSTKTVCKTIERTVTTSYTDFSLEPLAAQSTIMSDSNEFVILRKHLDLKSPMRTLPYCLETFEEVSPLTEYTVVSGGTNNTSSKGSLWNDAEQVALAYALLRTSKQVEMARAVEVCSYALAILQHCQHSNTDMASVLCQLGKLRCRQGALECGAVLLREAAELYGRAGLHNDCAQTWCDLGDAYIADRHPGDNALLVAVMSTIRDQLESEHCFNEDNINDSDDDSSCDEEEGSYCVQTREALSCYQHALAALPSNQPPTSILSRVADCHFLAGHYSRAMPCYEEALVRAPRCDSALYYTAHVLCMLGTANLMLGQISRAISVLESAVAAHSQHCTGEVAFTCALLCATCEHIGREPRAVMWGVRACQLHAQIPAPHTPLQQWYVAYTLYALGRSYSTLRLTEKSLQYLEAARLLADHHQSLLIRVLHATGDAHVVSANHHLAAQCYKEALDVAAVSGTARLRLLDALATAHVSGQEYIEAAGYLQEALHQQNALADVIDGGLIGVLHRLAITHTLAADIDSAIDCRRDCVATVVNDTEMLADLCSLATLYLVKGFLEDDGNEDDLIHEAALCYEEARHICDNDPMTCVHEANYLHQCGDYADAILLVLPIVFKSRERLSSLSTPTKNRSQLSSVVVYYRGVEQAVLPPHLHCELVDDCEFACLRVSVFAPFIALLCCCQLHLQQDAEACLLKLMKCVHGSKSRIEHSILGYSLMELRLFREAAECFSTAFQLDSDHEPALNNMWTCWCLDVIQTFVYSLCRVGRLLRKQQKNRQNRLRDAGYYDCLEVTAPSCEVDDHGDDDDDDEEEEEDSEWLVEEETVETPMEILQALQTTELTTYPVGLASCSTDIGYNTSNESIFTEVEWLEEEEETVDTPVEILNTLKCRSKDLTSCSSDLGYTSNESLFVDRDTHVSTDHLYTEVNIPIYQEEEKDKDFVDKCSSSDSDSSDTFVEWHSEIVQTPSVIMDAIQSRGCVVDHQTEDDVEKVNVESDDETFVEWETEEIVQTTSAIMSVIGTVDKISESCDKSCLKQSDSDNKENCAKYDALMKSANSSRSDDDDDDDDDLMDHDEWGVNCVVATELMDHDRSVDHRFIKMDGTVEWQTVETIDTPAAILKVLDNGSHLVDVWQTESENISRRSSAVNDNDSRKGSMHNNGNNKLQLWTDKVTMDTPDAILNMLNGNGHASITTAVEDKLIAGDCGECCQSSIESSSDEELWETWGETVVETPPEILRMILANEHH